MSAPSLRSALAPQLPITAVLLLLWGFFVLTAPATFLSRYIYVSFMTTLPFVAIVAMGMTLVVVSGEMDLSFASNMAMSGFLFAVVTRGTGSAALGIAAGLTAGAAIGLINGLVVVGTGVPSIVVTIGFDFFWRGCVMLLSGGLAVAVPFVRKLPAAALFVGRVGGVVPAQFLWAAALAFLTAVVLHRTAWGDTLRFIGDNREAARMMGLPVARARVLVFVALGLMAGFSGILACLELANWWPTQGEGYLLLVFASVFIGGTSVYGGSGSVWGTLAGAAVIGMIEAGVVSAGWSGFWTRFVHGLVLVFSVSFYALTARRRRGSVGS